MSATELEVQRRIQAKTPHMQKRKTAEQATLPASTSVTGPSTSKTITSPKKVDICFSIYWLHVILISKPS